MAATQWIQACRQPAKVQTEDETWGEKSDVAWWLVPDGQV